MLEIAEVIPPKYSPVWKLAKQCGVDLAVAGLPFDSLQANERVSSLSALQRMKDEYEKGGYQIRVIESRPPLNKAKRGLEGRDEEIDVVCELLTNMGKLGIPVWCYEWMTDFNWVRTNMATPSRGGSVGDGASGAVASARRVTGTARTPIPRIRIEVPPERWQVPAGDGRRWLWVDGPVWR